MGLNCCDSSIGTFVTIRVDAHLPELLESVSITGMGLVGRWGELLLLSRFLPALVFADPFVHVAGHVVERFADHGEQSDSFCGWESVFEECVEWGWLWDG